MISLKTLSDETLLSEINKLVKEEREILTLILHHLREIDRRRLYSKLKLPSLYEYCVSKLGYSQDQAYRRIQAMRLLSEVPEIETKISDGSLSLTHLSMAQSLFKREEKKNDKSFSKEQKLEILEKFENTTSREAEKIVFSLSSSPVLPTDKIKAVSESEFEFRFVGAEGLYKKIQKLKGLMAHKSPNIQMAELINMLCDLGLEKWDKSVDKSKIAAPRKIENQNNKMPMPLTSSTSTSAAQIRRLVWQRSQGRCERCGSGYALQIDHRIPKGAGGQDSIENLRLLCRSCNQRAAIEFYGISKMAPYIESNRGAAKV